MRFALGVSALTLLASTSIAGCASPDASKAVPSEDVELQSSAERTAREACTADAYRNAFATYKESVALAKRHLAGDTCDDATTYEIVAGAGRAIEQCWGFEAVYATSRWAKPVRDVLAGNLALPVVTGKLVPVEGGRATWTELRAALPGTTLFGPAPGAFGNMSKLAFGANGEATLHTLHVDEAVTWSERAVRYEVGAVREDGSVSITVVDGGTRTEYVLEQSDYGTGLVLPIFDLRPVSGGDVFSSLPSECEA